MVAQAALGLSSLITASRHDRLGGRPLRLQLAQMAKPQILRLLALVIFLAAMLLLLR